MEITLEAFTIYGPLGLLAAVMFLFAIKLFRVLQDEREKHDKETTQLTADHKAEMQAMVERYIKTTTTQVEQYHTLADKISAVLASLTDRMKR